MTEKNHDKVIEAIREEMRAKHNRPRKVETPVEFATRFIMGLPVTPEEKIKLRVRLLKMAAEQR